MNDDLISRQALMKEFSDFVRASNSSDFAQTPTWNDAVSLVGSMPSAQPEDYTELKREFLRMASYIDVLLECSDEQKETLIGFISRLAEFMPWTERD